MIRIMAGAAFDCWWVKAHSDNLDLFTEATSEKVSINHDAEADAEPSTHKIRGETAADSNQANLLTSLAVIDTRINWLTEQRS